MKESFPSSSEEEHNPERILSREEILRELIIPEQNHEIERELSDADGIYLMEVLYPKMGKRLVYQRKGLFAGRGREIESAGTSIRAEDLDDGYSRTIADYDPITGKWKSQ